MSNLVEDTAKKYNIKPLTFNLWHLTNSQTITNYPDRYEIYLHDNKKTFTIHKKSLKQYENTTDKIRYDYDRRKKIAVVRLLHNYYTDEYYLWRNLQVKNNITEYLYITDIHSFQSQKSILAFVHTTYLGSHIVDNYIVNVYDPFQNTGIYFYLFCCDKLLRIKNKHEDATFPYCYFGLYYITSLPFIFYNGLGQAFVMDNIVNQNIITTIKNSRIKHGVKSDLLAIRYHNLEFYVFVNPYTFDMHLQSNNLDYKLITKLLI
jgi:hypothetical protein